jgi:DNA-binding CsgD family transcriptional regulator
MSITLTTAELARVLDSLGAGSEMYSRSSRLRRIHITPVLQAILREDPDQLEVTAAMRRMAEEMLPSAPETSSSIGQTAEREFATAACSYCLRATCVEGPLGDHSECVAIIAVERLRIDPLEERLLRRRFRLTVREAQLARLLASGKSNQAIAEAMEISPNTAQHYTERVMLKLDVRSRAEVGARILFGPQWVEGNEEI